ncbi:MAG: alcohol dehydrogenase catalytic domain-containing protein [Deltaproteobacteria bacterium]|nr:alcohol dehydrogenase catalytic domain-containing protein [Deltaproteobacteria bacterium]
MKAAFYEGNKSFRIDTCDPKSPGHGEVRINVSYCGICGTDIHIFNGAMDHRIKFPQIIGHEMSGFIAEIGEGVEDFAIGDAVVVRPLDSCGECPACRAGHNHICQSLNFMGIDSPGAFQSSWTVPAYTLHRLPKNFDMKIGAMIEPLSVACHDVRLGEIKSGETVVVLGGGPIGMLIGMVSQSMGARVILSEPQDFRLKLSKELGFDSINPKEQDLTAYVEGKTEGAGADAVFEVSGSGAGAEIMTSLVRTRGRIILVAIFPKPIPVDLFRLFWRELKLCGVRVYEGRDYEDAISLAASGKIPIDKLITAVEPIDRLPQVFPSFATNPDAMKVLIQCSEISS